MNDERTQTPLTWAQRALWFLERLNGPESTHNLAGALRLTGALDVAALHLSVQAIVDRHANLRASLREHDGFPLLDIGSTVVIALAHFDFEGDSDPDERRLLAALRRDVDQPFDLGLAPLLRVSLYRLSPDRHVLLYAMHHAISDGWSTVLFAEELAAGYRNAQTGGKTSEGASLPSCGVLDHARAQKAWMDGAQMSRQRDWWREQLTGLAPLELPSDRPRSRQPGNPGASVPVMIDSELTARLKGIARSARVTPFALLLAAYIVLIHRLAGAEDFAVGVPTAGRDETGYESLIGYFVNMVALRANPTPAIAFDRFLDRVWGIVFDAFENRQMPFEALVAELSPERELNRNPLFQVTFAMQNVPARSVQWPGLLAVPLPILASGSHFDLNLSLTERDGGLHGYLQYRSDLFDAATVTHWVRQYGQVLRSVCADSSRPIGDLAMMDEREAERLMRAGMGSRWRREVPDEGLKGAFERRAAATPDAIAISQGEQRIRYRALDAQANRIAQWLHARSIGTVPETLVGLCLGRSTRSVVALIGVVKAGCAYLPLDPEWPRDRLALVIEQYRLAAVLVDGSTAHKVALALPSPAVRMLALDDETGELLHTAPTALPGRGQADALACVMLTSGSTGRPKGVAIEAAGIIALVIDTDYVRLAPTDRVAHASNPAFDAATFEIWGALLNGAELVIIDKDTLLSPALLTDAIARRRVTTMFVTTALFNAHARNAPTLFAGLTTLLIGGEACDAGAVARVLRAGAPKRLLNVYGPTETTTFATWHTIHPRIQRRLDPHGTDRADSGDVEIESAERGRHPIGRPIASARCHVLDGRGRLAPVGAIGEIHIGGRGIAKGYLDATATHYRHRVAVYRRSAVAWRAALPLRRPGTSPR